MKERATAHLHQRVKPSDLEAWKKAAAGELSKWVILHLNRAVKKEVTQ